MTHQNHPQLPDDILEEYQIELAIYKLHEQLFGLASHSRAALKDSLPVFQQLKEKDPDRDPRH